MGWKACDAKGVGTDDRQTCQYKVYTSDARYDVLSHLWWGL